jgi:Apea-like HEPN
VDALFINDKGKLSEIPEYEACLRELNNDPVISRQLDVNVGSNSRGTLTPSATSLMKRIISMGRINGQYKFDPNRFDQEYRFFEESFYSDHLLCVAVAPLQALVMEDSVVTLSDNLEIRRLEQDEMEPYRTPRSSWNEGWCAVRAKYEVPKIIGPKKVDRYGEMQKERVIEEEANDRIEDVVNALRLYGNISAFHSGIIHLAPKWFFIGSHSVANRVLGEGFVTYKFGSENDTRAFPLFWNKLENKKVKKELGTAVRRFSYSCVRHQNEDKIVDLMIAAESLFLHDTREGEKRFRLALRAGRFLSTDPAKQKEVYDRMRKAYDLRSLLVHGGSAPSLRRLKGELTENDHLIAAVGDDVHTAILKAINILSEPQATALNDAYWDEMLFT